MSARQAAAASARLRQMRTHLAVLSDAGGGRRATKTERGRALAALATALREPLARAGLAHFSARERGTGAREAPPDGRGAPCPLGWGELAAEVLDVLHRGATDEAAKSRPGSLRFVVDCGRVLREVVAHVIATGRVDVLRDLVPGYLARLATWHSEPRLADLLDDAWQCLLCMMEAPQLRALVTPAYFKFLVNACFQQAAERGQLYRAGKTLAASSRRVFVLLATEAPNSDVLLTRSSISPAAAAAATATAAPHRAAAPSAAAALTGYSLVMQRACLLLHLSKEMGPAPQREAEATALAVLAAALAGRALDMHGSRAAARVLLRYAAPAAATCWTERRHRPHALALTRVLVRLVPCAAGASRNMDLLRERVARDFAALDGASGRGGVLDEPEGDLIDIASLMYSAEEAGVSLRAVGNTVAATAWLRVLHAALTRRDNKAAMACLYSVEAVVHVFERLGGDSRTLPPRCALAACSVVVAAASIAACLPSASQSGRDRCGGSAGLQRSASGEHGVNTRNGVDGSGMSVPRPSAGTGHGGSDDRNSVVVPTVFDGGFGSVPRLASIPLTSCGSGAATPRDSDYMQDVDIPSPDVVSPALTWLRLYSCLVRQLVRGRMSASPSSGRGARGMSSQARASKHVDTESAVLDAMGMLLSLGAISATDAAAASSGVSSGASDSLWSLALFAPPSDSLPTPKAVFSFLRTYLSVVGFPVGDIGSVKFTLVSMLLATCRVSLCDLVDVSSGSSISDAASAALGLIRGSCRQQPYEGAEDALSSLRSTHQQSVSNSVEVVDALQALFYHDDKATGRAAVYQSSYFRRMKVILERRLFPAGGGWDDRFILGDRDLFVGTEQNRRKGSRAARSAVDRYLQEELEENLIKTLSTYVISADDTANGKDTTVRGDDGSSDDERLPAGRGKRRRGGRSVLYQNSSAVPGLSKPSVVPFRDGGLFEGESDDDRDDDGFEELASKLADLETLLSKEEKDVMASASALKSVKEAVIVGRVVSFLGEYLAEGVELGLFQMALRGQADGVEAKNEVKIARLLILCSARLASSPALILTAIETLEVLPFALSACARLIRGVLVRDVTSVAAQESTLNLLCTCLTESIANTLMKTILASTCSALTAFADDSIAAVKASSSALDSKAKPANLSSKRKRTRRRSSDKARASKRPRGEPKSKPAFSDDSGEDDSGFSSSDRSVEENDSFSDEGNFGADPDDEWNTPQKKRNELSSSVLKESGNVADSARADHDDSQGTTSAKRIRLLCCSLYAFAGTIPDGFDEIANQMTKCLSLVTSRENKLSPDNHRRDVLVNDDICPLYLEVRSYVWELLLRSDSAEGADSAAEDIVRVAKKWSGAVGATSELTFWYAEEFHYKKRVPTCETYFLESKRAQLLLYCARYFEYCLGVGRVRNRQILSERRAQISQLVCACVETVLAGNSSKLPRESKIVLLRTVAAATELVLRAPRTDSGTPFSTVTVECCDRLQSLLELFLNDVDTHVRFAASALAPLLLRAGGTRTEAEADALLQALIVSLPPALECHDVEEESCLDDSNCVPDSEDEEAVEVAVRESRQANRNQSARVTSSKDFVESSLELDDDAAVVAGEIRTSFERVGFCARGSAVYVVLSEVGALCFAERGRIFYHFLERAGRLCGSDRVAFGGIVRLAVRAGYADPDTMFRAYRRQVLTLWLKDRSCSIQSLESFPVKLILPLQRSRTEGFYDWLSDNADELLPLLLVSDTSSSLKSLSELASALETDTDSLCAANATAIFRILLMQGLASLCSNGKKVWDRICSVTERPDDGQQILRLAFKNMSPQVLAEMMLSMSCGREQVPVNSTNYNVDLREFEFRRDCTSVHPPEYDPLVCLLGMDIALKPSGQQLLRPDELVGSIIERAKGAYTLEAEAVFANLTKRPSSAAYLLARIWQGVCGPPSPPSMESRRNSFMALGTLYRTIPDLLLKDCTLRCSLFELVAVGFRFAETARNAKWLLQDICGRFTKYDEANDMLGLLQTSQLGLVMSPKTQGLEDLLQFDNSKTQRWWEIFERILPCLVSITGRSGEDPLVEFARRTIRDLFCAMGSQNATEAVALLDPLPSSVRNLKTERRVQSKEYALLAKKAGICPSRILEYRLWRFGCVLDVGVDEPVHLLERLRCLRITLEKHRLDLQTMLHSRSLAEDAHHESPPLLVQLVDKALRSLLLIIQSCGKLKDYRGGGDIPVLSSKRNFLDQSLVSGKRANTSRDTAVLVEEEAVRCIGILGVMLPANMTLSHTPSDCVVPAFSKQPHLHHAAMLLCRELRSESAIARQIAIGTLPMFLQTAAGNAVWKESSLNFRSEFAIFRLNKASTQKPKRCDPLTGCECPRSGLPEISSASLWTPVQDVDSSMTSGVPSRWVRTLCATLARASNCAELSMLEAICFASASFSAGIFPLLLRNVVKANASDPSMIGPLSERIRFNILENRLAPIGALRMVLDGIDALCDLTVNDLKTVGVGKFFYTQPSGPEHSKEYYKLKIPYMVVARAANRCGLFYSALRFATLHVDAECIQRERQLRLEISGKWSGTEEAEVLVVRERAKIEAGGIICNALKHLQEPDGQRAVSQEGGVVERAAVVSSVEKNWSRMMGTLDVLQRSSIRNRSPTAARSARVSTEDAAAVFSYVRERDIFRSMLGLGGFSSAVKYWEGLCHQTLERGLASSNHGIYELGADVSEFEAASDLTELRYEVAWKLGEWQTPPSLSMPGLSVTEEGLGLHEGLHSGLRALRCGDVSGVLSAVDRAKSGIASKMSSGLGGSMLATVRDAALNLCLTEDLYLAATVLAQSKSDSIAHASRGRLSSSSGNTGSESLRETSSILRAGAHFREVREGCGVQAISLNDVSGVHSSRATVKESANVHRRTNPVWARFSELSAIWERQDGLSAASQNFTLVSSSTMESLLSLRLALVGALGVTPYVSRMSAELATSILNSDSGNGAWSRAANALGSFDSAWSCISSKRDLAKWRVAEARLCWQAGEDGNSKQDALKAVKSVIANELGCILRKAPRSSTEPRLSFSDTWAPIDGDEFADIADLAVLRAEACCLASTWSAAMRAEEPMTLFCGYFQMGLAAFPSGMDVSDGKCDAHYAMAVFADRQMMSIEAYQKTKPYAFKKQSAHKMEKKLDRIEERLNEQEVGDAAHAKALKLYLSKSRKELNRELAKLEEIDALYVKWQLLAAEHYAACLRSGNKHDLRAAFRLVFLWTENGSSSEAMNDFMLERKHIPGRSHDSHQVCIPTNKLLPLVPQIASRIGKAASEKFEFTLETVLTEITLDHPAHCLWLLVALSNLKRPLPAKEMNKMASLYVGDKDKNDAADRIIESVRKKRGPLIAETLQLARYYFAVSEIPPGKRGAFSSRKLPKVSDLSCVPVPTVSLPLHGYTSSMEPAPTVSGFEGQAKLLGGLSAPLLVTCVGSNGVGYPQVVKYGEDMRQDAVMEQLFVILNELLISNSAAAMRSLLIRTYRVVPLSPFAGVVQFVPNTLALKDYLIGTKDGEKHPAHVRHRPQDLNHYAIFQAVGNSRFKSLPARMKQLRDIWPRFQPVMRYFFLEKFSNPADLYYKRMAHTHSAAVMSIVGWMVGLGDRHLSNILIDCKSAELVHIDFGIAFEGGKLLSTPELMPFRLTRDMVDGMGIDGVEGVFRKSCEVTMHLLRDNKDLILMILQVFLHDPLYNWSISPLRAIQGDLKRSSEADCDDMDEEGRYDGDVTLDDEEDESGSKFGRGDGTGPEREARSRRWAEKDGTRYDTDNDGNEKAMQAVSVISEKLEGLQSTDRLSVEAHVARLIDEARSFEVIAPAYCGWTPWV